MSSGKRKTAVRKKKARPCAAGKDLLEALLAFAMPRAEARKTASRLSARYKGLKPVLEAGSEGLEGAGVDPRAAELIGLVRDLTGVYLKEKVEGRDIVKSPHDLLRLLRQRFAGCGEESFLGVYLSARNEVISVEVLHEGRVTPAAVYPRKAIETAFRLNARSVIFVHNIPQVGRPGRPDGNIARSLERAAAAVDILVHDHIVLGSDGHFSARENGWSAGAAHASTTAAEPGRRL